MSKMIAFVLFQLTVFIVITGIFRWLDIRRDRQRLRAMKWFAEVAKQERDRKLREKS